MAKSRGLPPSFQIDVPEASLDGPVNLGDYLDEEIKPVRSLRPTAISSPTPPPVSARNHNVVELPRAPQPKIEPLPASENSEPTAEAFSGRTRRPSPRKQLNMSPETIRMVDELLQRIQTYSVQKDAKASEMFHALVSVLYECRELINLAEIEPRGKWGSPTARAFPVSLKNAFRDAIAEWSRRNS